MYQRILGTLVCFLVLGLASLASQTGNQPPGSPSFTFQPGQSVYIVAYKTNGKADIPVESRVVEAFIKQKVFKVTGAISEADFVFLVYAEYSVGSRATVTILGERRGPLEERLQNIEGFALLPEQYSRHKGDWDALRDVAAWRQQVSPPLSIPESHSGQLVKKFHEAVTKDRKTPAGQTANQPPSGQPFTFQPGQSVYIAVYKTTGAADLTVERRVKNAFMKQKVFKIADKIGEADFVFLVYTEYTVSRIPDMNPDADRRSRPPAASKRSKDHRISDIDPNAESVSYEEFVKTAQGFALLPELYSRHKGDGDALRDVAYWFQEVSSRRLSIPESHSGQLVKKFHEAVTKGNLRSPGRH